MKVIGVFIRKDSKTQWSRLKAIGGKTKHVFAYQATFPDQEIALFEYEQINSGMPFNRFTAERMKRVY